MHLVESAGFNKGKDKIYAGVPGNLVAFACRLSFQRGFEGNISFISKTRLIDHYIKTLGGEQRTLTKEEERAISLFIQNSKQRAAKQKNLRSKQEKVIA